MISSNKTKGFTLVELLIVIVVIAILAAISIVAYNGVTQKARDDERATNARNLLNAAASYQSDKDNWPDVANDLKGYSVIRLDKTLIDATDDNDPTNTNKNHYGYVFCKDGTTTTNKAEATGVKVSYWKDADGAGKQTIQTGKCS
ncbi:MAG: type II secretion system protein [Candidatus Saccharibacteria bacterium]|nr:type II secretion system protein [Candidatus Saccharibacteria bacterium]